MKTDWLPIGEIHREHGIRGEVKVTLFSGDATNLCVGQKVQLQKSSGEEIEAKVLKLKEVNLGFLALFDVFTNPEDAKLWRKARIRVAKKDLKENLEGEFYLEDLFGFSVMDGSNMKLGKLTGVEGTGNVLFLKVERESAPEFLVPTAANFIRKIDREKQTITLDLPEGYLLVVSGVEP